MDKDSELINIHHGRDHYYLIHSYNTYIYIYIIKFNMNTHVNFDEYHKKTRGPIHCNINVRCNDKHMNG